MAGRARAIRLGVALLAAGALFDSPSLYVPGAALLALVAGGVGWVRLATRGLAVRREPGPATAIEGELYPLRVWIERGRVPLPGGELRDPALERPLRLGPNPPPAVSQSIPVGRRGRRRLEPTTLAVRDPLGLCEVEVRGSDRAEVLVLPRTERVESAAGGAGGGLPGGRGPGEGDGGGAARGASLASEIDGVRPHQDGVPASRIHWRTAARRGELFDRLLVPGSESSHAVVLEAAASGDLDSLDAAVRAAASLCLRLAPAGGCALCLPGEARPLAVDGRLSAWPRAHARLAVVEAGAGPAPAPAPGSRGVAVLVSSALRAPGPRELARVAAACSLLVTPGPGPPGVPAEFTVAGCGGYPLAAARRGRAVAGSRAA